MIVPIKLTEQVESEDIRARYPLAQAVWEYIEARKKRVLQIDNSYDRTTMLGTVLLCPGGRLWEVRVYGPKVYKCFTESAKRRRGNPPALF